MDVRIKTRSLFKSLAIVLACGLITFGCKPEGNVAPKGDNPDLAALGDTIHQWPGQICGTSITGNWVDAAGNTSSGDIFGPASYGSWEIMRAGADMVVTFQLSRGYFLSTAEYYHGPASAVPLKNDGNVDAENLPVNRSYNPSENLGEIRWPYNDGQLCPNDIVCIGTATIHQLDFLGNAFGETQIFMEGTAIGTDGYQAVSFCAPLCPGQQPPAPPCAVPTPGPGDDLSAYECGNGNNTKVTVCHIPPGNPSNMQEICISENALPAHIVDFKPANNPCMGHHSGCHIGPCDPCGAGSTASYAGGLTSNCPGN